MEGHSDRRLLVPSSGRVHYHRRSVPPRCGFVALLGGAAELMGVGPPPRGLTGAHLGDGMRENDRPQRWC